MQGMREREESNIIPKILATGKMEETEENQVWRDIRIIDLGMTSLKSFLDIQALR